ncbi:DUF4397 domain-containing protein [Mucilaginibacter sp. BT774]|uniref:DUF4397 domain-containing protein n=1 Tax=Mucilaginibacter sp. BT774 TaxID=3062276 RepID=UPI0026752FD0|nr:DUF4397 domain-containing protein [Mucilaginibacter sp. BT774]MDO3628939.1 DUF4397 domain-containing protein [Mucilaginibacter sp. BT774]
MKIYSNPLNRWTALLGIGCFISLVFTSCLKTKNDYTPPPLAYVTFFQASPGEQPLDLYFNSNKVNQTPLNYGDGIDYFQAYPGLRTVNLYHTGGTSLVYSDTITLKPNIAYSLFMVNTASNPGILLVNDSISRPSSGMATVRFINVSPDAPAVDLAVKDSAAFVSNKAFKGFSSFIPKIAGKTYTFEVRRHGTNTVLTTLSGVTLNSGLVYTIWLHGLANTAIPEEQLMASIVTNAYY